MSEDRDEEGAEFSYDGSTASTDRDSTPDGRSRSDPDDAPDERSPETPDASDAESSTGTAASAEPSVSVDAGESFDGATNSRSIGEGSDGLEGRAEESFTELFEETTVDELDSDRVWAKLQADGSEPREDVQDRVLREIDKRTYCHQCPHFDDPPDVGCTRDGTTILELVDVRTFRVANCPVVLEEESLENG